VQTPAAPVLVGRDDQLHRLLDELEAVSSGGRVIGISGEPGIGRTALLERVAEVARTRGFRVLTARGRQAERGLPFSSLHQLLRPVLKQAEHLPPRQRDALLACFGMSESTEFSPFFTSLAVLELLVDVAGAGSLLVCLDDVHWMDQPSVEAPSSSGTPSVA
jgi:predicted ATPase